MQSRKKIIENIAADMSVLKRKLMAENHRLKSHANITPAQGQVLFIIHQNKEITASQIATKTGISKSAATQLIDALVDNGHLIRICCDDDRRSNNFELSEGTKQHLSQIKVFFLSKLSKMLAALNDQELETYMALNHKICKQILNDNCSREE